ncbi:hypothetical protein A5724_21170 [Mycobacterium sp. ACS1612]|nr:hypothetical protein A5724_21170 [Mycobacterium sp. ACS1612]
MSTPRTAAVAGVLFALLFATSLVLIRLALPEGEQPGAQWLRAGSTNLKIAATIMPFAAIAFLWFMGVVRDGLGRYEDKFFSTVFIGSGLLFIAMMFVAAGVGAGLERSHASGDPGVAAFGQMMLLTVTKTYALRMAAVFMISLATIWLRTGLMPRWLVLTSYLAAVGLLIASDVTMWLVLAFPVWVLVVSLLLLARAGVIALDGDG